MAEEELGADGAQEPATSGPSAELPKGMSRGKLLALVLAAALLIGVPLGYLAIDGIDIRDDAREGALTMIGKGETELEVTMDDLKDMEYLEEISSYQNRFGNWKGLGTYRGVELCTLADLVGGMNPGDIMTLTASDGYSQNLSYYQVYAEGECLEIQGPMVLAYQLNDTECPEWEDGPMVAALAPDQAFSNIDFNSTCAKDSEFLGSSSAGSLWVRNVQRIEIRAMFEEWTVVVKNLEGIQTEITRTKFVSLHYFEGESYTDPSERTWSGVPVDALLGVVDDDDPTSYNTTLADSEYRIIVEATDGYSRAIIAKDLVDIGAIFAIQINGTALPADFAPVRLVGPDMSGNNMVSMICSVTMDHVAVILSSLEESKALTVTELSMMDLFSGSGYFKKSTGTIVGPLNFTGVPVKDLVDEVFEGENYSLCTVAWDGYDMTYTPMQVENGTFPVYDLDGALIGPQDLTMMLAIEDDGERLPYNELRIVIVDDETQPVTDGHYWAKMVKEMNIVPYVEDWTIELSGVTDMVIDRQTFESLASCYYHTTYYNYTDDDVEHSYEGVPLWVLVATVDGGDVQDGHYMFNDALVEGGYTINVSASDGWYGLFDAEQVARNDSIIVAYKFDGEPLDEGDWPLRIVGDNLSGSQKVRMIESIALEGYADAPAWELDLIGVTNATLSEWDFIALFNCDEGVHLSYYNYTDEDVEHSYAGIPLWVLIGMVDGGESGHREFNETLADLGYNVTVRGSDDYNKTFSIDGIEYNNSLIVALTFDGKYLTGDEYPLMLVGEDLPGSLRIKSIASIELVDLPE